MRHFTKKYQVFVSSTYEDLKEERQEIMHALLELDCIPSGMELFPASNEDQWSLIRGVIDECDYYVLVLGGRYGSFGPDGVGYTEKEYHYALQQGKPIIAFLHKDPDSLSKRKSEETAEGQSRFTSFRELAEKKMCKYWSTPHELGSIVSRSLIMLQRRHPGIGWVRGDLVPDKESSVEILELKKQVERLNKKLDEVRTQAPPGTENLAQGEDKISLAYTIEGIRRYYEYGSDDVNLLHKTIDLSWDFIFYHISPLMLNEANERQLKQGLNEMLDPFAQIAFGEVSRGYAGYRNCQIDQHDFHSVVIQLRALGLIAQSIKPRSVKDTELYWTLTPYGDSAMNKLRAISRHDEKEA